MVQYVNLLTDTICSPITAPGYSGVAVIRVSGDEALKLTRLFVKTLPENLESHHSYLGYFVDAEGNQVDQILVSFFKKKHSFTGDECIEISCHGNPLIVNQIINSFLHSGCRAAERGEFSFRAFYNGKLDLVQAESIHQLVLTKNHFGSHVSLDQLKGKLSHSFKSLEDDLILAMSHLEASIDFVEQDIEVADDGVLTDLLQKTQIRVQDLLKSYDVGKSVSESYKVLLVGPTNVGKSSLFNKIFGESKAIVTDIAGTTRDLVTGQIFLGNNNIELMDSAGLRESFDPIERIGMEKTIEKMNSADLLLYVLDSSMELDVQWIAKLPAEKTLFIFNKIDLLDSDAEKEYLRSQLRKIQKDIDLESILFVSAIQNNGIADLVQIVENRLIHSNKLGSEEHIITQARHYNHLVKLNGHLDMARELLLQKESPDFISQDLALGLSEVHRLLGKEYDDEVLDKIFAEFCLGK